MAKDRADAAAEIAAQEQQLDRRLTGEEVDKLEKELEDARYVKQSKLAEINAELKLSADHRIAEREAVLSVYRKSVDDLAPLGIRIAIDGVGKHRKGDVVKASEFRTEENLARLLSIGAIEYASPAVPTLVAPNGRPLRQQSSGFAQGLFQPLIAGPNNPMAERRA